MSDDTELTRLCSRVALLEEQLRAALTAARHDPLTGLYNRAGLAEAFDSVSDRYQLALFDLDRFKAINDTYSHAAGDAVLVYVAGQLSRYSISARLGGDEFVIVDLVGEMRTCWSVRLPDGQTVRVTASVGVTPVRGSLAATLGHADAAMYRAKQAGRGRVAVHDPMLDDRPAPEPRPAVRLRDRTTTNDLQGRSPRHTRTAVSGSRW